MRDRPFNWNAFSFAVACESVRPSDITPPQIPHPPFRAFFSATRLALRCARLPPLSVLQNRQ